MRNEDTAMRVCNTRLDAGCACSPASCWRPSAPHGSAAFSRQTFKILKKSQKKKKKSSKNENGNQKRKKGKKRNELIKHLMFLAPLAEVTP